jgi:cyclic beta-1,2-glucan synthetase
VTAADNDLPPDNFQETPQPVLARRTSPTNIGLYLLATTAAHDLGWIGRADATGRLERTLATIRRMPQFRGHLYNWHATDDLRVLEPAYVSTVDSGNLAGHLIAVAQACAEWQRKPVAEADWRAGLSDTIRLAERALGAGPAEADRALADLLADWQGLRRSAPRSTGFWNSAPPQSPANALLRHPDPRPASGSRPCMPVSRAMPPIAR